MDMPDTTSPLAVHPALRMSDGERGCALSHITLVAQCDRRAAPMPPRRPALILEDDAVLCEAAEGLARARRVAREGRVAAAAERHTVLDVGRVAAWPWGGPQCEVSATFMLREVEYGRRAPAEEQRRRHSAGKEPIVTRRRPALPVAVPLFRSPAGPASRQRRLHPQISARRRGRISARKTRRRRRHVIRRARTPRPECRDASRIRSPLRRSSASRGRQGSAASRHGPGIGGSGTRIAARPPASSPACAARRAARRPSRHGTTSRRRRGRASPPSAWRP